MSAPIWFAMTSVFIVIAALAFISPDHDVVVAIFCVFCAVLCLARAIYVTLLARSSPDSTRGNAPQEPFDGSSKR